MLNDKDLEDPIVYLSNLTHLKQSSGGIPQDVPTYNAAE